MKLRKVAVALIISLVLPTFLTSPTLAQMPLSTGDRDIDRIIERSRYRDLESKNRDLESKNRALEYRVEALENKSYRSFPSYSPSGPPEFYWVRDEKIRKQMVKEREAWDKTCKDLLKNAVPVKPDDPCIPWHLEYKQKECEKLKGQ